MAGSFLNKGARKINIDFERLFTNYLSNLNLNPATVLQYKGVLERFGKIIESDITVEMFSSSSTIVELCQQAESKGFKLNNTYDCALRHYWQFCRNYRLFEGHFRARQGL